MEDRYLFKAKFDDSDRWVKGQLVEVNDTYLIIPNHASKILAGWFSTSNIIEVKKDTICQCIGLKDKNGNLIWENDILLQKTTEKHWCEWQRMGLVKYGEHDWNEGVYGYKNIGFFVESIVKEGDETRMKPGLCQEDLVVENYPYEVIGNIFDNPELLESEEK